MSCAVRYLGKEHYLALAPLERLVTLDLETVD
jgi:hypothetical protein